MQKHTDLRFVFAAVATLGLKSLWNAMKRDRVIRGRFIDGYGGGCLFHWLSRRTIIDRPTREAWLAENPLLTPEHDAAMRRIIVGWDAVDPELIVKGVGYEKTYPQATYKVSRRDVMLALREILRARRAANRAEREQRAPALAR